MHAEVFMDFITTPETLAAGLPFSLAVAVGDVLHLSGQIGNVPGRLELVPGGIEAETRQMMRNIEAILAIRGLAFRHLISCTVMLADIAEWGRFNAVYLGYFDPARLPARSAFATAGLALGARVEMACLASLGGSL